MWLHGHAAACSFVHAARGVRLAERPAGRPDGRACARVVSGAEKKAFDRGGPVWPPRSNVTNNRLRGGFAPPAKIRGVWGAAPPSQKQKILNFQETVFLEKLFQEKQLTV